MINALSKADFQRVLVVGNIGSGKTTVAKAIGAELELPVVHLDKEFWLPNWQLPNMAEWNDRINTIIAAQKWVVDGNYTDSLETRVKRADLVVYVNPSTWTCIRRYILRSIFSSRGRTADLPLGCRESLQFRNIKKLLAFRKRKEPKIAAVLASSGNAIEVNDVHAALDHIRLRHRG